MLAHGFGLVATLISFALGKLIRQMSELVLGAVSGLLAGLTPIFLHESMLHRLTPGVRVLVARIDHQIGL